jgi:hypothetical protein
MVFPLAFGISLNCGKTSSWDISIVMDFCNRCLKHGLMDPVQMREICLVSDKGRGVLILKLRESWHSTGSMRFPRRLGVVCRLTRLITCWDNWTNEAYDTRYSDCSRRGYDLAFIQEFVSYMKWCILACIPTFCTLLKKCKVWKFLDRIRLLIKSHYSMPSTRCRSLQKDLSWIN